MAFQITTYIKYRNSEIDLLCRLVVLGLSIKDRILWSSICPLINEILNSSNEWDTEKFRK